MLVVHRCANYDTNNYILVQSWLLLQYVLRWPCVLENGWDHRLSVIIAVMLLCVRESPLPLSTNLRFNFWIIYAVWYFRIVLTGWYCGIVPTVWYFRIVPTVWYFRIVPTVWYLTNDPTVWYFKIVPTVWYLRTAPTVWYFRIVPTVWYFLFF